MLDSSQKLKEIAYKTATKNSVKVKSQACKLYLKTANAC